MAVAGLVSTTIAGAGCKDIIGDALRSVEEHVEACIIVDTGMTSEDKTAAVQAVQSRVIFVSHEWKNDFGAARNHALEFALVQGFKYAITLDTDERIVWNGDENFDQRFPEAETFMAKEVGGSYAKERIIRLRSAREWVGRVHEFYPYDPARVELPSMRFTELPKSPLLSTMKFSRDVQILTEELRTDPTNARWWFYLGESYLNLGILLAAIYAYEKCAENTDWDEEGAWACYRAACCQDKLGQFQDAISSCVDGLSHHPGFAELHWMAGLMSWNLKRPEQAAIWATSAIQVGINKGKRNGFCEPMAYFEGPYDVLRFALRATGDSKSADVAESRYQQAKTARLAPISPA